MDLESIECVSSSDRLNEDEINPYHKTLHPHPHPHQHHHEFFQAQKEGCACSGHR
ncbi:hypothetical protein C1H46_004769 [Malus baccata]|uniref:Uncharacterized protein n=1 Tax=Malus baccata TaxID=106549 RepID=A0A540NG98_MALBA|nr:hypothetical protein C1H46_004769 [Malus baccata]